MKAKRFFERLVSVHLIERREDELLDDFGHFTWHWTYPTIEATMRSFIEKRLYTRSVHSHECSSDGFDFYHLHGRWVYVKVACSTNRHLLVLLTTDFCPQTYERLLTLFGRLLQQQVPLMRLLHYYLELVIHGQIVVPELSDTRLSLCPEETRDALHASRDHIKSIIKLFHLDVILIYTALLLRRRIAIYHHNQATLMDFMCALPAFITTHRAHYCPCDVLYPNVDLHSQEQVDDLREQHHFIATFHDPKVEERQDIYDIYVNLAAVEITISHKARDVFTMTKTHKEVAMALVRVAENDATTSEDVIHEIAKKTDEIRNALYLLMQRDDSSAEKVPVKISKERLKQKLLSPNLESFYWNLALAEGIADTGV